MKYVVGLMSGTSVDGIDAALVRITDKPFLRVDLEEFITLEYSKDVREEILTSCDEKQGTVDKICRLNFKLGELLANGVIELVKKAGIGLEEVELIGSHGQTVYHNVGDNELTSTLQIGAGGVIAERTGITTVSNFRVRDVAAGGEGAPLVPYVDYLLYTSSKANRVLQNIGGIANYTYLPARATLDQVEGADTGPGNMLIDRVVEVLSNGQLRYDKDGCLASRGRVSKELLNRLMEHPFIKRQAPKTTGREDFGSSLVGEILQKGKNLKLSDEDIVATVTAFTACSIADAYRRFIGDRIDQVIISGGGSYNPVLVEMIRIYLNEFYSGKNIEVLTQEDLGFSSEAKEAVAFAVLAYQTMKGRANNLPRVTGAKHPVVLGDITPGNNFYRYLNW
ncbi:MAG: anhydro-N-acetylmuramic acid kinase [Halanaerobiales bacterium]|nr:anhydro-N-acetylmuramic acid kinase [Halanaerobiales bacterium]